jgi:hypothetical protein
MYITKVSLRFETFYEILAARGGKEIEQKVTKEAKERRPDEGYAGLGGHC